jgi:hypothetical protein
MNSRTFVTGILVLLVACGKEKQDGPPTKFKFTVAGKLYEWNGAWPDFSQTIGATIEKNTVAFGFPPGFTLIAVDRQNGNNDLLSLSLLTDTTLSVRTYTAAITDPANLVVNDMLRLANTVSYTKTVGDFTTVIVTKIENGLVSGTFSSKRTEEQSPERVEILNGEFHKVKIKN